jgi:hypothetical protein
VSVGVSERKGEQEKGVVEAFMVLICLFERVSCACRRLILHCLPPRNLLRLHRSVHPTSSASPNEEGKHSACRDQLNYVYSPGKWILH